MRCTDPSLHVLHMFGIKLSRQMKIIIIKYPLVNPPHGLKQIRTGTNIFRTLYTVRMVAYITILMVRYGTPYGTQKDEKIIPAPFC